MNKNRGLDPVADGPVRTRTVSHTTSHTRRQVTGKFSAVVDKVRLAGPLALYNGALAASSATFGAWKSSGLMLLVPMSCGRHPLTLRSTLYPFSVLLRRQWDTIRELCLNCPFAFPLSRASHSPSLAPLEVGSPRTIICPRRSPAKTHNWPNSDVEPCWGSAARPCRTRAAIRSVS